MRLKGKAAIVTGGASGIGRAIACRFAEEGANVTIGDIDVEQGEQVAAELSARGLAARFVRSDITDEDAVRRLVESAAAAWGGVDILVNNAFYRKAQGSDALELTNDDWDRSMDVMLKGSWWMIKHCLPHMLDQGKGVIVNISSRLAFKSSPKSFAYCVAKAGMAQMTRSVAQDFGRRGVRAVSICPGMVETPATAEYLSDPKAKESTLAKRLVDRIAKPEEIAAAAAFLASDEAAQIQGEALIIDGGVSIV